MKKLIVLFLGVLSLTSCGGDKKKEAEQVVEIKDNYSIFFESIYEKDDELILVFKKNGYWDYENQTKHKITGQPNLQIVQVNFPAGLSAENVQIDLSSNKEQKTLTLKGVRILNNGKEVLNGSNMEFIKFFNTGTGLTWDDKNLRYNLLFDQPYPPRMVGNDALESILKK